ncbi:Peroxidase, family 2-domain-containing protein [Lentinula lateritia]|uniref:Peroxidase, family 2-domain-containing protein n=1 Tax=Lentinula lateritia TaxID=40482 RepID=A0ABQ8V531_9AGAR|nr:Peroxidase, family 2-domain-containing protein [Lentinula lateritia]
MNILRSLLLVDLALVLSSCSMQIMLNTHTLHHGDEFDNIDWNYHRWIAPGEGDLRSPCPGMNTLANHGFISRDGRNITIPMVLKAADVVYNNPVDPVLNLALKLALLTTDAPDSFTLDDLKLHGTVEHDASISRLDYALGDNLHFNSTVFSTLSESNPDSDVYNTTSVGQVLEERLALAKKENAELVNTIKERQSQLLEASLFLSAMGDPRTGVAPKRFVQIFFREERLPLAEGWKRPASPINSESLINIMTQLNEASQTKGPWLPSSLTTCPWVRLQPEGAAIVWPPQLSNT